jgi:hypothetical protein
MRSLTRVCSLSGIRPRRGNSWKQVGGLPWRLCSKASPSSPITGCLSLPSPPNSRRTRNSFPSATTLGLSNARLPALRQKRPLRMELRAGNTRVSTTSTSSTNIGTGSTVELLRMEARAGNTRVLPIRPCHLQSQ